MNKPLIEYALRVGVFGTFLGHGLLAVQVNPQWLPFLTVVGFSIDQAMTLMPLIGMLDICLAVWVLLKPNKYILLWMIFWTFLTALMRPISGGLFLDFVERSVNWAAPLALFFSIVKSKRVQNHQ